MLTQDGEASGLDAEVLHSIATDEDLIEYHELAGAERTFLPRKLPGNGIANRVRNTVETSVEGGLSVGEDIEIAEIPVASGSELDGTRLTGPTASQNSTAPASTTPSRSRRSLGGCSRRPSSMPTGRLRSTSRYGRVAG